jgi:hypothetical protein
VPLGFPVEPDEYSQKQTSSGRVGERLRAPGQGRKRGMRAVVRAARIGHNEASRPACEPRGFFVLRQQLDGDDRRFRTTVGEDERVVERLEQRVHRDRHDAGLDRAEEDGGEVDRIEESEDDALLDVEPERAQRTGRTVDARGQLIVRVRAGVVDERRLLGARGQVARDQVDRRVVERGLGAGRRCRRRVDHGELPSAVDRPLDSEPLEAL